MKKRIILLKLLLLGARIVHGQQTDPLSPLLAGENIANAIVIAGPLPYTIAGTTAGYLDDYDEACPYESTAPDVVYAYTPSSDVTVDIDLCGSSYDTKVFVYETEETPGVPYACNDDFYLDDSCGNYVSKIEGVFFTGGNTYYIIIDGYSGSDYGAYNLAIHESGQPQCTWGTDVLCPPGALAESETCGSNTNGGCDMAPGTESWETIPPGGGTICGTAWADGGNRDTDWFELTLEDASNVTLTANSEREIFYGLVETTTPGAPTCATRTGNLTPSNDAGPCNKTFLDLGILDQGTYWILVEMAATEGFPCTNHYSIDFEVVPVTCSPPEALSTSNITSSTAGLSWTPGGSETTWEYVYGESPLSAPSGSGTATSSNTLNTITSLTAKTDYQFYVRAGCGAGFSSWAGPGSFTTLCDTISSFPWAESFDLSWSPPCWTDDNLAEYGWDQSTFGSAHSGSGWAYCNLAGSQLSSPEFHLSSDTWFSFWYRVEDPAHPQEMTVKIGNDILYQIIGDTSTAYKQVQFSLAAYTGQTISISFTGQTGTGGADYGICLDDVSVKLISSWTGNISTDWNNSSNWSSGHVPDPNDVLLIPSSPPGGNFPDIGNGIIAKCYNIIIASGATLRVAAGGTLTVLNP